MITMFRFLALLVATSAVLPVIPTHAQSWKPTRSIEIIVGSGPGGGADLTGRLMQKLMQGELAAGVPVSVVNKTGGNGSVAAAYLAEKKGDVNTIGFFTGVWLTNPLVAAEAM